MNDRLKQKATGRPGTLALVGAGEYLSGMVEVDKYLLGTLASEKPRVVVMPTAAAQEADYMKWAYMGISHFQRLGAEVDAALVVDQETANDRHNADLVARADLVYLSGGNPRYLLTTLRDTLVWECIMSVYARGGVLAGCSAGAMIMGKYVRSRREPGADPSSLWLPGFQLVGGVVVIPHFDRVTPERLEMITSHLPPGASILGIEENTAMLGRNGRWEVRGRGAVVLITGNGKTDYHSGQQFDLQ